MSIIVIGIIDVLFLLEVFIVVLYFVLEWWEDGVGGIGNKMLVIKCCFVIVFLVIKGWGVC